MSFLSYIRGLIAQRNNHRLFSSRNIGAAIYSAGTLIEVLCVTGYIIDTYQKYAASAMAAIFVLRGILAVVLPLAAPSL